MVGWQVLQAESFSLALRQTLPLSRYPASVVEEAKMTQSAPTKLLISRMPHETIQVAHNNSKSLRLCELG
jgi:hypothetical protein